MRVVTPDAAAYYTGSKYLGVLVAARYGRALNEYRRGQILDDDPVLTEGMQEKLTTIALESVAAGEIEFRLVPRRRDEL